MSRGMAVSEFPRDLLRGVVMPGDESSTPLLGHEVEASAGLRPDQPIDEATWSGGRIRKCLAAPGNALASQKRRSATSGKSSSARARQRQQNSGEQLRIEGRYSPRVRLT